MNEQFYGTLTVRLLFVKRIDGKRIYGGVAILAKFHGTLPETREDYREWRTHNSQLAGMVQAMFETRTEVHVD